MDTAELEAAYASLVEVATGPALGAPAEGEWDADRVLAHVVASERMLAAASADLLEGRIPVVDNRPTQSECYLEAIAECAGGRIELVAMVTGAARELVMLTARLDEAQLATRVPTIIVDGGRFRIERPVAFSVLVGPGHVREHVEQMEALRR